MNWLSDQIANRLPEGARIITIHVSPKLAKLAQEFKVETHGDFDIAVHPDWVESFWELDFMES